MATLSKISVFSNGTLSVEGVPPPTSNNLRKMLRLFDVEGPNTQGDTDQIGCCWTRQDGNCSGVSNFFWLDNQKERDLIRRVNTGIDGVSWEAKLHWAVWDKAGGIYRADTRDNMLIPWKDTSLVFGSKSSANGEYNSVKVLSNVSGYTDIETIPVLDNYDHLSVETHPWLFHRIYVTNYIGKTYDAPKGIFYKPLFSPVGRRRAAGNVDGYFVREQFLGEYV